REGSVERRPLADWRDGGVAPNRKRNHAVSLPRASIRSPAFGNGFLECGAGVDHGGKAVFGSPRKRLVYDRGDRGRQVGAVLTNGSARKSLLENVILHRNGPVTAGQVVQHRSPREDVVGRNGSGSLPLRGRAIKR